MTEKEKAQSQAPEFTIYKFSVLSKSSPKVIMQTIKIHPRTGENQQSAFNRMSIIYPTEQIIFISMEESGAKMLEEDLEARLLANI